MNNLILKSVLPTVQSLSRVQLFATLWIAARQASLPITSSQSLLKLMSIESVMPSNHFILSHPLFLPLSMFPSIRVFSNDSVLRIRRPKYWSSSFNISPSNEYSGLISFRMDWLDLLAVQGTLKSLLHHHSSWQTDGEIVETVIYFIFLGSKITAEGDCSHEIKRYFFLRRKAVTNLDSI